jgi:hypothetical protein
MNSFEQRINDMADEAARVNALQCVGVLAAALKNAALALMDHAEEGNISESDAVDIFSSLGGLLEIIKPGLMRVANNPGTLEHDRLSGLMRDWRYWFKPFEKRFP